MKMVLIIGGIVIIGVIFLAYTKIPAGQGESSSSGVIWHQFTRRLFDRDFPQEKKRDIRQYDMTAIGSHKAP